MAEKISSDISAADDLSSCRYITKIVKYSEEPDKFYTGNSDYAVREINGELYRFDYTVPDKNTGTAVFVMNSALGIMTALIIIVMLYIRRKILAPFNRLTEVPYELSKGILTSPVKESRNRFFGRFLWGIDLLRENIEEQKNRELELQKEKKTLLLSLSHDIKTPLSAIKLYSKALSKGLYTDKEKQLEIAESINGKADEIENYISQIIKASSEDFIQLDVQSGEFYLSELLGRISDYYSEKTRLIHTDFTVGDFSDCLVSGDIERSTEVLQNIIENALKYGDGKSIEILAGEEDGCQLITVRNSGNTLPENELPHIFDSFYRGSNAENKNGSGLGLYICRSLMRKMNGDIYAEADSEFMNVSCVFQKA
ncbi:MAG: HAMP domain-containing histidine kinase [Oscillospiraceae bacterium]|nr:HAMP domain-containing histidine kinase [Oscillospiraceae bacterium]